MQDMRRETETHVLALNSAHELDKYKPSTISGPMPVQAAQGQPQGTHARAMHSDSGPNMSEEVDSGSETLDYHIDGLHQVHQLIWIAIWQTPSGNGIEDLTRGRGLNTQCVYPHPLPS